MVTEQLRLFIGTGLDDATKAAIHHAIAAHRGNSGPHWIDPAQWHVTSLFIGAWPEHSLEQVFSALERVSVSTAPFRLQQGRLCGMPVEHPTMIWVRFRPEPAHRLLHVALSQALGLSPDTREPFWPHITLARGRNVPEIDEQLALAEFPVLNLSLFRSDATPEGRAYTPLATFPLKG